MRLYVATYPDGIVGVVLVDALNEFWRAGLTPEQWAPLAAIQGVPPSGLDYPEMERLTSMPCWTRWSERWPPSHCPSCRWRSSRGSEDEEPPGLPPGVFDAQLDAGWARSSWRHWCRTPAT